MPCVSDLADDTVWEPLHIGPTGVDFRQVGRVDGGSNGRCHPNSTDSFA